MKSISKFDFMEFYGGYDQFAVSMQRYTKDEAIAIAEREMLPHDWGQDGPLMIGEAWVTHRAGLSEDNEPCVGWWLDYQPYKRSCPAWVFHRGERSRDYKGGYVEAKYERQSS